MSTSEAILTAARDSMQVHGFGGLNFRDLAADVGIKAASIYHHFPSKAELAAAVAKRYWEDAVARLDDLLIQDLRIYGRTLPGDEVERLAREHRPSSVCIWEGSGIA